MTPQRSRKKREASKSPPQELDGDSELEDAEDPDTYTRLSACAIADIVRHEIQSRLSPVQSRLGALQTAFESRMDGIDLQLCEHKSKIDKLERTLGSRDSTPRSRGTDTSISIEKQLTELQAQIDSLRLQPAQSLPEPSKIMVVGGLASLADMPSATQWMVGTLQSMRGPSVAGTYTKTDSFQGLLFVKFHTVMERDTAVALIRSASLKLGEAHVWPPKICPFR